MDTGPPLTDEQRDWVATHHRLAIYGVRKFHRRSPHMDPDDLLIACENGLIAAARNYSPDLGRVSTYAFKTMFREVMRVMHKSIAIPVPERYYYRVNPESKFKARFAEQAQRAMALHKVPSHPGSVEHAPSGVWVVPDHRPNHEEAVDAADGYRVLLKMLGAMLAPSQLRALVERDVDGRLFREIGDRMGRSKQAVEQGLVAIRRRVREAMVCSRDGVVEWRKDVSDAA
jgi:RNA polymerase sigma factor (sigma-70 family)